MKTYTLPTVPVRPPVSVRFIKRFGAVIPAVGFGSGSVQCFQFGSATMYYESARWNRTCRESAMCEPENVL